MACDPEMLVEVNDHETEAGATARPRNPSVQATNEGGENTDEG